MRAGAANKLCDFKTPCGHARVRPSVAVDDDNKHDALAAMMAAMERVQDLRDQMEAAQRACKEAVEQACDQWVAGDEAWAKLQE